MHSTCSPRFPLEQRAQGERFIYVQMNKVPYKKIFLSYREQIAQLKRRGLLIGNETKALHLLQNISYYRLSGYWYPLLANKEKHLFKPDADFETAFDIYKFDKELRKLIIAELEKIEVAIRVTMAYELSMAYGSLWIANEDLFANAKLYSNTLAKINDEYARSDEEFIVSFKSKYSDPLPPSFILLEITSFGTLSRIYGNLKSSKIKRQIAASFGLSDKVFASWLHSMVYIRNVCAHHSRLWNRPLGIQPLFPRKTAYVWLSDTEICNNRIYYILSMVIYFLNSINPKHSFKQKLENLFATYPNIDRTAMGFPADRNTELLWK